MHAIRELGPDASLIEIAAGAGVSKPALYSEFGDKEGLVDAIAERSGDQIDNAIYERLREDNAPLDNRSIVTVMVRSAIDFADHDPHIFALVLRGLRNTDRPYAENPIRRRIHTRAMTLVEMISPNTDSAERELLTSAFVGMLLTAAETWSATREVPKELVVQRIAAAVYAGMDILRETATAPTVDALS